MLRREDAPPEALATMEDESDERGGDASSGEEIASRERTACLVGEDCEEAIEPPPFWANPMGHPSITIFRDWFLHIFGLISRCPQFCGRDGPFRLYCSFLLLFIASCILIICSVVNILILCKLRVLKCKLTSPWKDVFPFMNTEFV